MANRPKFDYRKTWQRAVKEHVRIAAELGRVEAIDTHLGAPRGGFLPPGKSPGEERSLPGDQPAVDTGELLSHLERPIRVRGKSAYFNVNYRELEDGTAENSFTGFAIEERPMGQIVINRLKQAFRG